LKNLQSMTNRRSSGAPPRREEKRYGPFQLLAIIVAVFVAGCLGFCFGQSDVRGTTVVRLGGPYYRGVYFGTCAWVSWTDKIEACATGGRIDERGNPL
jgi:hypothetical protein